LSGEEAEEGEEEEEEEEEEEDSLHLVISNRGDVVVSAPSKREYLSRSRRTADLPDKTNWGKFPVLCFYRFCNNIESD
jgi:hypothetical protein